MKLPNPENAVADLLKLQGYSLNLAHPEGKHKARVFASLLGLQAKDAAFLQQYLLAAIHTEDAQLGSKDAYGQRYIVDMNITTDVATAKVRSVWMVRVDEDFARLVTCYVL